MVEKLHEGHQNARSTNLSRSLHQQNQIGLNHNIITTVKTIPINTIKRCQLQILPSTNSNFKTNTNIYRSRPYNTQFSTTQRHNTRKISPPRKIPPAATSSETRTARRMSPVLPILSVLPHPLANPCPSARRQNPATSRPPPVRRTAAPHCMPRSQNSDPICGEYITAGKSVTVGTGELAMSVPLFQLVGKSHSSLWNNIA